MHWSPAISLVLAFARLEAQRAAFVEFEPEHLFIGLCRLAELIEADQADRLGGLSPSTVQTIQAEGRDLLAWMRRTGIVPSQARRGVRDRVGVNPEPMAPPEPRPNPSPVAEARIDDAWALAAAQNVPNIQPIHLAQAIFKTPTERLTESLLKHLAPAFESAEKTRTTPRPTPVPTPIPARPATSALPAAVAPFGRDLTELARENRLPPMIGRKDEIKHLLRVLAQQRKGNAILVGEAGVGKTCIVNGLAHLIASGRAPGRLKETRIFELSMPSLIAGTKHRGDLESRLEGLIRAVSAEPNLVLFIDEIHTLVGAGAGGESPLDIANIVKPALADGRFRVIGATTSDEYETHIARDHALERRFEAIWIDEPSRADAVEIVRGVATGLEHYHGVTVSDAAIETAVDVSVRFMPTRRLPDKAIDLIDQAAANRSLDSFSFADVEREASASPRQGAPRVEIRPDDVVAVVAELVNVPRDVIVASDSERMAKLAVTLNERIVGQQPALDQIVAALDSARKGLRDARRPMASFLFYGPTGVGKTETAKVIAELLFGSRDRVVRLDMTEYAEKHQVARLLGAPPGYVGHDEPGVLSAVMRHAPASVVLFDEIEKAHPDVLHVLLQILDEGTLTDSRGRQISFREAVVVLTTNLSPQPPSAPAPTMSKAPAPFPMGAEPTVLPGLGVADANVPPSDDALIRGFASHLRPELLGRLGRIVGFGTLSRADYETIAERRLQVLSVQLRLQGLNVPLPLELAKQAVAECSHQRFGVRELERRIEAAVANWLDRRPDLAVDPMPPTSGEFQLPVVGKANDALRVPAAAAAAAPSPGKPRVVRDAMLRAAQGGIFHLRARGVLTVGRHEASAWPVFLMPRNPDNDQASLAISRQHLRLLYTGREFAVEDLGSASGTWLGNARISPENRIALASGDVLNVGGVLTVGIGFFPDLRQTLPALPPSALQDVGDAPPLLDDQLGYRTGGPYRCALLQRLNNRDQERCVWMVKYALLGADATKCEIPLVAGPTIAAEVRFTTEGYVLAAQTPDLFVNGNPLAVGTPQKMHANDTIRVGSTGEEFVYIERVT